MSTTITLEKAAQSLKELLQKLAPGETVTLVEANGMPLAVLVSIGPAVVPQPIPDWSQRWREMADRIGQAWKTEQSGLQILAEMRR
jgi:antitoxin (DNA-binding transcriptional repressor) of toxin-antitoxin stability system